MNPPDFSQFNQPVPSPAAPDNPQPPQDNNHQGVHNPLAVMQPGEQIICEVKRHPIGIFAIFIAAGFLLVVLAILAFVVAPNMLGDSDSSQVMTLGAIGFTIVAVFTLAFVFIANIVYWGNRWVVTSDSLTQVTQTSLFSKQSSQLSLGNLEDVTSEKNGILAQMLNFGVLKAETAGERSKFVFLYCPNPDYYAKKILAAREQFELAHHGGKQDPYVQQQSASAAPQPPQVPQPPFTNY